MKQSVNMMKKGNCRMSYQRPGPSADASYIFVQPRTSARKAGTVRPTMRGMALQACAISRRTWPLRYFGCLKVALSKMKM